MATHSHSVDANQPRLPGIILVILLLLVSKILTFQVFGRLSLVEIPPAPILMHANGADS